jgi:5'-methylthioadenosine phosphorylase
VGSLREEIKPGDFVIPDQIIDRTKGIRSASYFEDMNSTVAHVGFGDPFSMKLSKWLEAKVREALKKNNPDGGVELHTTKCVVCMEGPQFSTRAESKMYRAWGGDIINMSVLPEAKLAREAEIRYSSFFRVRQSFLTSTSTFSYSLIATATDYDSWRPHEASVTASDVFKTLTQNAETSRFVVANVLEDFFTDSSPEEFQEEEKGCMKLALMKQPDDPEDKKKLAFILPEYFA